MALATPVVAGARAWEGADSATSRAPPNEFSFYFNQLCANLFCGLDQQTVLECVRSLSDPIPLLFENCVRCLALTD